MEKEKTQCKYCDAKVKYMRQHVRIKHPEEYTPKDNDGMHHNVSKTRKVSYRKQGIPSIIIEGKWLKEKYDVEIGDEVKVDYEEDKVIINL